MRRAISRAFMSNNQDILGRRVYLVKPKKELIELLECSEVIKDVSQPHMVFTEELAFEQHLEGYRSKILELCKLQFLAENIIEYPLIPIGSWVRIPRISEISVEAFDLYWIAEEATYTDIPMTWK